MIIDIVIRVRSFNTLPASMGVTQISGQVVDPSGPLESKKIWNFRRSSLLTTIAPINFNVRGVIWTQTVSRSVLPNLFSTTAYFLETAHQTAHCIYGTILNV